MGIAAQNQPKAISGISQTGGYPSQIIARYVLAWNCFLQVYAPNNAANAHKLSKPDNATLQAIAKLYNTERLSQPSSHPACTPENMESWLIASAKAVRFYEYPASVSLDVPLPGQETGELLDRLTNDFQESVLNEVIIQEEREHLTQRTTEINRILSDALEKLDTAAQTLLQTYYKQGLTQQDIALQLGIKQYTVSRQLTKIKKTLLMELAQWSQKTLHISVTSDVIDSMSNSLEEWLIAHYRPIILSSPVES